MCASFDKSDIPALPDQFIWKGSVKAMAKGNEVGLLGEWPVSAGVAHKPANHGGYKVVSVRLRHAEFVSFSEQVQKAGLTHNLALRIVARRVAGFLELDSETRQTLRQVSTNIGEISQSLSMLQRDAQRAGSRDVEKLFEVRAAFGREFAVLDDKLQQLLNVSKRRVDGQALLKRALGK